MKPSFSTMKMNAERERPGARMKRTTKLAVLAGVVTLLSVVSGATGPNIARRQRCDSNNTRDSVETPLRWFGAGAGISSTTHRRRLITCDECSGDIDKDRNIDSAENPSGISLAGLCWNCQSKKLFFEKLRERKLDTTILEKLRKRKLDTTIRKSAAEKKYVNQLEKKLNSIKPLKHVKVEIDFYPLWGEESSCTRPGTCKETRKHKVKTNLRDQQIYMCISNQNKDQWYCVDETHTEASCKQRGEISWEEKKQQFITFSDVFPYACTELTPDQTVEAARQQVKDYNNRDEAKRILTEYYRRKLKEPNTKETNAYKRVSNARTLERNAETKAEKMLQEMLKEYTDTEFGHECEAFLKYWYLWLSYEKPPTWEKFSEYVKDGRNFARKNRLTDAKKLEGDFATISLATLGKPDVVVKKEKIMFNKVMKELFEKGIKEHLNNIKQRDANAQNDEVAASPTANSATKRKTRSSSASRSSPPIFNVTKASLNQRKLRSRSAPTPSVKIPGAENWTFKDAVEKWCPTGDKRVNFQDKPNFKRFAESAGWTVPSEVENMGAITFKNQAQAILNTLKETLATQASNAGRRRLASKNSHPVFRRLLRKLQTSA